MSSLLCEYRENGIILKLLTRSDTSGVLEFYKKNSASFDCYETEKPRNFYTFEFQRQMLEAEYDGFIKGTHVRFFMFDERFPNDIIGCVSFFNIRKGFFEQCCTGYKIDEEYRRMGFGTRMLSLSTKIMTSEFGLHRIEAYILPSNEPSIHLAEKCGYELEGVAKGYVKMNGKWTDHLRYVYIS